MNQTLPTPYPELNGVLHDFIRNVQEILNNNFVGAYLQGSFAVGDFDLHSDVDYVVAIDHQLSPSQINALQVMHERVYGLSSPWAQHLEGSYFPKEILRQHSQHREKLWYLDNGARSLIESDHCNTILVRWVIREEGVTLAGPSPMTLVDPISAATLRMEIGEVITGWGREIINNPDPFNNRFYQTYIVLSYCRMLHDLDTGFPGSKAAGAKWAKANLDSSWSELIDRAWDGRPNPALSVRQPADPKDFENTLKFVRYVIRESTK
jgi:Domain of unknown function (DUF4111)